MLQIVAQLFMACLGLMMFKVDRRHKLAILLFAALCLTCVQLPLPFAKGCFGYLPFCFLLSELRDWRRHYVEMRHTVVWGLMLLMMVSAIIFAINSPHCNTLVLKAKLIYNELMQKTFLLAFVMFCIWDERDLKPAVRYAFIGLLILTALGVVNYITKQSFWLRDVYVDAGGREMGSGYMYQERFRVQSMFRFAFDYGFTNTLFAVFFYYARIKELISRKRFLIAEACCLFGVYTCACRTVHVCYLLAIMVYAVGAYGLRRKWVVRGVVALVALIVILPHVPAFQEYMDLFQKALSTDSDQLSSGGSSIGMRILQLGTMFYYLMQGNVVFGNGKDYFYVELGGDNLKYGLKSYEQDLFGMEGVYLWYLLERGIFGYLCYLIFYAVLFFSALRLRKAEPHAFALFATAIIVYFFYANSTGELGSVAPTMLMMGIGLKMLYVRSGKLIKPLKENDF